MIYIFHGFGGNSQENWFPWMKKELEKLKIGVTVPNFPNTNHPKLEEWMRYFESQYKLDNNSLLIGHSLGCPFILHLLEKYPAKAAFLVAGFGSPLDHPVQSYLTSFTQRFSWTKIKAHCPKFVIIQSDNDTVVPMTKAQELQEKLNGEIIIIKNAGHFNESDGYTQFPQLLKMIKELL